VPTLIIKNLPLDLYARLKAQAKRNSRSLAEETIELIERELAETRAETHGPPSMPLMAERRELIKDSGLFDREFYLARHGDVAGSIHDPFDHYVWWGADENRHPSERFDPSYYAEQCALRGVEPGNRLLHYLTEGKAAGFFTTPIDHALQRTGMPVFDLVQKFESWGTDCEFGLVQRRLGAEPNDLFRFSDPTPQVLVNLIRENFAHYGENCYVSLDEQQPRREWFIVDHDTRTSRHTRIFEGDMPKENVQEVALFWTRLLRAKTAREIADGQKIYVMKSSRGELTEEAVAEVAKALRSRGPSWLLWVEAGEPVGHCEIAFDGLLRARIDRVCERGHEYEFSLVGWLQVLCAAWNSLRNRIPASSPTR
jgi:plasmid stability protein